MMIQHGKRTERDWLNVSMTAMLLISGCTTLLEHPADSHHATGADAPWGAAFNALLWQEASNRRVHFANSPWGRNLDAILHPSYAAASGRRCRRLTLSPEQPAEQQPRIVLACQSVETKHWQPVRLLHLDGRAMLSAAPTPKGYGVAP